MMKRTIAALTLSVLLSTSLFAQSVSEDRDVRTLSLPEDGRAKIGLLLGYPSGITFGYRFSNWFEVNLTAGYNFAFVQSALVSANGLFTLVNIPIGNAGVMPLSVGPQVNFLIGSPFYLETVADVRLEYTFKDLPLNIFAEMGFGFRFFDQGNWVAWNGGAGVRYVF